MGANVSPSGVACEGQDGATTLQLTRESIPHTHFPTRLHPTGPLTTNLLIKRILVLVLVVCAKAVVRALNVRFVWLVCVESLLLFQAPC